jgi:hypothetical protein
MGKTFALFSTDPVVQRRLRQAHAARNAYIRAALGRLLARCVGLFARARLRPSGEWGTVHVRADIDRRR